MHRDSQPIANQVARATALGTTPQTLFAASGIAGDTGSVVATDIHVLCAGGGVIIFRAVDDSPEYFRVSVQGNGTQSVKIPMRFASAEGLEVLTTGATGAYVAVFYHVPGKAGLGV